MADMDIAPALLEKLRKAFHDNLAADQTGAALLEKIANGGKYPDAMNYAESVGRALAEAFRENLSSADLPDGRMYWNIADRVIRPLLGEDHALIAEQAAAVQQTLNKAAGLGLKAQKAPLDEDRVYGILNRLANEENYDKVAWILQEPVMVFSRSVVDDTLERNVSFQGKSGLSPKIIRKAEYKCCKWCSNLGGVYQYPDVPKDVYRRHENCRCLVEYSEDGVKRQNVHTKRWTSHAERAKIAEKKQSWLLERAKQDTTVKDAIKAGTVKDAINRESQARHCFDSPTYIEGRSYLYGGVEDATRLYEKLRGTGNPVFSSSGGWARKERVENNTPVGVYIARDGTQQETRFAMIVYSKTGSHIYPRRGE